MRPMEHKKFVVDAGTHVSTPGAKVGLNPLIHLVDGKDDSRENEYAQLASKTGDIGKGDINLISMINTEACN